MEGAAADFERAHEIVPKDEKLKKQLKRAKAELQEQQKENAVVESAKLQMKDAGGEGSSCHTTQTCVEQLQSADLAVDEATALLKKLTAVLEKGDDERVFARSAGAIQAVCMHAYTAAAAAAVPALYQLSLNQRNLELLVERKGFLSHVVGNTARRYRRSVACSARLAACKYLLGFFTEVVGLQVDMADLEQPPSLREGALSILAEGSRNELCRAALDKQELGHAISKSCIGLLAPPGGALGGVATAGGDASEGEALHSLQTYAGTTLGNLATETWFRMLLAGRAEELLDVLLAQSLSPFVDVAQKAASALTNLASDASWRGKIGEKKRLGLLVKVLQIDLTLAGRGGCGGVQAGQMCEVVMNALGVLANCALEPTVQVMLVTELKVLPVMVALLTPPANEHTTAVVARATMVLGRVTKIEGAADLLAGLGAMPKLLGHLDAAVTAVLAAEEPTELEEFRLLEASARMLTGCVMESEVAVEAIAKVKGGFKAMVAMLGVSHGTVAANTSLCLANVAKVESTLPALGKAGAVPALIQVAHKAELEKARQNAGIALARLAKVRHNVLVARPCVVRAVRMPCRIDR